MKTDKSIRGPMIAGLIVHSVAVIIYLICIIVQSSFYPKHINVTQKIIPAEFILQCVILLVYFIFLLVMNTNEGSSRRTVGGIMLVVYTLIRISFPYVSMVSNFIMVRMRDSNYLAASGTLSSYTNMIISPLAAIAAILVVAAVARYGISESGSPQDFADQNMFNG